MCACNAIASHTYIHTWHFDSSGCAEWDSGSDLGSDLGSGMRQRSIHSTVDIFAHHLYCGPCNDVMSLQAFDSSFLVSANEVEKARANVESNLYVCVSVGWLVSWARFWRCTRAILFYSILLRKKQFTLVMTIDLDVGVDVDVDAGLGISSLLWTTCTTRQQASTCTSSKQMVR